MVGKEYNRSLHIIHISYGRKLKHVLNIEIHVVANPAGLHYDSTMRSSAACWICTNPLCYPSNERCKSYSSYSEQSESLSKCAFERGGIFERMSENEMKIELAFGNVECTLL